MHFLTVCRIITTMAEATWPMERTAANLTSCVHEWRVEISRRNGDYWNGPSWIFLMPLNMLGIHCFLFLWIYFAESVSMLYFKSISCDGFLNSTEHWNSSFIFAFDLFNIFFEVDEISFDWFKKSNYNNLK